MRRSRGVFPQTSAPSAAAPLPTEPPHPNPNKRHRRNLPGRNAQKSPITYLNPVPRAAAASFFFFFSPSCCSRRTSASWTRASAAEPSRRVQNHTFKVKNESEQGSKRRVSPIHTQPASARLGSVCPCSATASPRLGRTTPSGWGGAERLHVTGYRSVPRLVNG